MKAQRRQRFALGVSDIPRWAGLVALVALMYLTSTWPSELKPLPIIDTVPPSGDRDVPLDTALQIQFEAGGYEKTFDKGVKPVVKVMYEGEPEEEAQSATVTLEGDTFRAVLEKPLDPGRRVRVAVSTRYGRDLVWTFYTTQDRLGPSATPLPQLE